ADADRPADRCGGACREVDRPVPSLERTLTFNLGLYRWEPVHLGEARHQPAFGFARLHVDVKCLRLGHVAERAFHAALGIAAVESYAHGQARAADARARGG